MQYTTIQRCEVFMEQVVYHCAVGRHPDRQIPFVLPHTRSELPEVTVRLDNDPSLLHVDYSAKQQQLRPFIGRVAVGYLIQRQEEPTRPVLRILER